MDNHILADKDKELIRITPYQNPLITILFDEFEMRKWCEAWDLIFSKIPEWKKFLFKLIIKL